MTEPVRCPTGKRRHLTRDAAMFHSVALRQRLGATENDAAVYKCKICKGWHVGHRPGMHTRAKRRRW